MFIPALLTVLSLANAQNQPAQAGETPDLNAQVFRPAVDGEHFFWLNDGAVGPTGQLQGRALLQWVDQPLIWRDSDGAETALVDQLYQLDVLAGVAYGPVRFGLDVPLYLRSTGTEGEETGLGDVALDLKGRILDHRSAPLGLALGLRVALPTATVAAPLGSPGLAADLGLYVHRDIGRARLLANVGTHFQPESAVQNVVVDDQLFYGLGVGFQATDAFGLSTELVGQATYGELGNPAANPLQILPGATWRPGQGDLVLRSAVGLPLNSGIGVPETRVLLALAFEPSKVAGDSDGDGILDADDQCPDEAEDRDRYLDEDGCPEPTQVTLRFIDERGDAVPEVVATVDSQRVMNGQGLLLESGRTELIATAPNYVRLATVLKVPAGPPTTLDVPMEAALGMLVLKVVGPEGQNLPARIGVKGETYDLTGAMELPLAPGVVRVDVEAEGFLARRIPTEVKAGETTQLVVSLVKALAEVQGERIEIKESVYFETAKDVIKSESFSLLDQVAMIMKENPEILGLRIEGHTDSRGDDDYNLELSKNRAAAVLNYLVARGVERSRLVSEGFGEQRPLDSNQNETAWAMNRRVDFFIAGRASEADPE